MLRRQIYPALGDLPLDQITTEHVARLCAGLTRFSRKTLANILATLAKLLRTAVDLDVLRDWPCARDPLRCRSEARGARAAGPA
ncbi:MAG: hypothetical protein WBY94_18090, partial [Polyangiaceae bacterium]